MEMIVLAGGMGTRLKGMVHDVPKPMAPFGKTPFLEILLNYAAAQGVSHAILSVGYMHDVIQNHFKSEFGTVKISYSVEDSLLGTGGAIKKALSLCNDPNVLVSNGDSFFDVNYRELEKVHNDSENNATIALKPMLRFDRYGAVKFARSQVTSFEEKKFCANGYINGGVYIINSNLFSEFPAPENSSEAFSFEADILQKYCTQMKLGAHVSQGYFVDIGIPEDYIKAQRELMSALKESI